MAIGMMEFLEKEAELVGLGVRSTSDECLARVNSYGFAAIQKFSIKNKGEGTITVTLKKRGQSYTIAAENIDALRVGATDRFRGPLANRRVTPGSITLVDTNAGVPQKIQDTNEDGVLWQTDGPAGPAYPIEVGSIDYNTGVFDFTFNQAVTLSVTLDYKHTDWTAFGTPISFDVVAGAGAYDYIIQPSAAQNYFASLRDESEFGWFAKRKTANDPPTQVGLVIFYIGDDSRLTLPLAKGEITGYPYHNQ